MATSTVSSSTSWISNLVVFNELTHSKSVNVEQFGICITPEARKGVFRGLKQLIYWKGQLQHLVSNHILILTCITPQGLIRPNIHNFKKQINDIIGRGRIASIYYPENTNFVGFLFHEAEEAQLVRQRVASVDGAPVCYIDKKDSNEYQIRILWIPIKSSCDEVYSALEGYYKQIDISPESLQFEDGDVVPSNVLSGSVIFKENVTLSSFPHILKISGNPDFHVLLVIKERPPMCLRCRQVGHIRRQCTNKKCMKCNSNHFPSDKCLIKSYASVITSAHQNSLDESLINEGVDYPDQNFDSDKEAISKSQDSSIGILMPTSGKVDNNGFSIIARRGKSRKLNKEMEDLNYDEKHTQLNSMLRDSNGYNVLTDEMEYSDPENIQLVKLNSKIGEVNKEDNIFTTSKESIQSFLVDKSGQDDTIILENSGQKKKNKRPNEDPKKAGQKKKNNTTESKKVKNSDSNFIMEVDTVLTEEKNVSESFNQHNKLTFSSNDTPQTILPSENVSRREGVLTRAAVRATIETLPIQNNSLTTVPEVIQLTKVDNISANLKDEEGYNDSLTNIDDGASYENHRHQKALIQLDGFPLNMDKDQILVFLADFKPIDWWSYRDEDHNFDGSFGAVYETEMDAMAVLTLDGKIFDGFKISATLEEYTSDADDL